MPPPVFSVPNDLPGLRVDFGIVEGQKLSLEFDPLLVKVIGVGKDWPETLKCLIDGLKTMGLEGPGMRTNVPRLIEILTHPVFAEQQGEVYTSFLTDYMATNKTAVEGATKDEKMIKDKTSTKEVAISAPMAGVIYDVKVKVGDIVADEDVVVVIESMKTQTEVATSVGGRVTAVNVNKGDQVGEDQPLVTIAATSSGGADQPIAEDESVELQVSSRTAIEQRGNTEGRCPTSMWCKDVAILDRESGAKGKGHHGNRTIPGVLTSKISPESAAGRRNTEFMEGLCQKLQERLSEVDKGGSEKAIALHRKRGKLLAKERIRLLVDGGTEFLELSALAACDDAHLQVHKGAMVIGIGVVGGVECLIISNESTIKGGTMFPIGVKKNLRAQQIAESLRLPCIYFVDSGGAFLPLQADVFPETGGKGFCNQARMSSKGIPQLACVCGMSTAGGAYIPAMCDEMIMVKEQGTIYLAGPPLVKAATGEDVGPQELGGAEMHTTVSGVADNMANDEESAITLLRRMVDTHTMGDTLTPGRLICQEPAHLPWSHPLVSPSTMLCVVPAPTGPAAGTVLATINAYEVLVRILDGSRFHEFKPRFGTTLVCGVGRICGGPLTGFLANHLGGPLTSQAALKATHFLMICEQRRMPVVFLQNIAGFMVGKNYERQGITKDGAKMVRAVSCLTVPKITIIVGGSHGAGNYAMAGRAYEPEFLFMWPNAQISVMGAAQAAHVLTTVSGKKDADALKAMQEAVTKKYLAESSCYYSTARIWDDGVIDPRDTRKV
ncbi:hypothetical protein FOL47_005295 [Perkinsus chesapeaki]|uniref:methylcrotonoyl-CoA carboxylase n=1 Tax=Perkinsus chesapeaki TaxID=330153 RepID=A0A7J6LYP7_PERCH|nr:hypothetical protein FOL47_005295 [Perkinsus chesapeaki]